METRGTGACEPSQRDSRNGSRVHAAGGDSTSSQPQFQWRDTGTGRSDSYQVQQSGTATEFSSRGRNCNCPRRRSLPPITDAEACRCILSLHLNSAPDPVAESVTVADNHEAAVCVREGMHLKRISILLVVVRPSRLRGRVGERCRVSPQGCCAMLRRVACSSRSRVGALQ